jgi:hypothetical protein
MALISRLIKFEHFLTLIELMLFTHLYYTFNLLVLLKDIYSLYYYNSENRLLREDYNQYLFKII